MLCTRAARSCCALAIMRAGISSNPISNRSSAIRRSVLSPASGSLPCSLYAQRRGVCACNSYGQVADAPDDADPFRHAHGPARIQQVENVRTLQAQVVGRQHRHALTLLASRFVFAHQRQQRLALLLVEAEVLPQLRDIRVLE